MSETIVALASTAGASGLNVVRLSGAKSLQIACAFARKKPDFFKPRYAHLCKIYFPQNSQNLQDLDSIESKNNNTSYEILRCAQNDIKESQNDKKEYQNDKKEFGDDKKNNNKKEFYFDNKDSIESNKIFTQKSNKDSFESNMQNKALLNTKNTQEKEIKKAQKTPQDGLLDECIIIYFKAPHSYTTEDVVEIQCHGGYFIAQQIISSSVALGAVLARPGEFSKRAFLGGRIDLSEAEAIARLVNAEDLAAHSALMRHLGGGLREFCENLRDEILELLAHSEVFIDYADEDLPSDFGENLAQKCRTLCVNLRQLCERSAQKRAVVDGARLCILGKPNVGKSSLLNALLAENRAIVSEIAGTTRDFLEERLLLGGRIVRLIDTAGIRANAEEIELQGIARSKERAENADILLAVFDNSREFESEDAEVLALCEKFSKSKKIVYILNKIDLKSKFDIEILEKFSPILLSAQGLNYENIESSEMGLIESKTDSIKTKIDSIKQDLNKCNNADFIKSKKDLINIGLTQEDSIKTKTQNINLDSIKKDLIESSGLNALKERLCELLASENSADLILIAEYQFEAAAAAAAALERACEPLAHGELELFSFELNSALNSISQITRPSEYSELLDKMFSNFCLGK